MVKAVPFWDGKRWKFGPMLHGKRKWFYSTKPGRPGSLECKRKASEWESSGGQKNRRLRDCWPDYLADSLSRGGNSNNKQHASHGRTYLLPALGHLFVAAISDQDWQDMINAASIKGVNGKPLSKKSLCNIRATVTDFYHWAKKARLMTVRPELDIPKRARVNERHIIQPDSIKVLFEPDDHWYVNVWRLMVVTGLRPGECLGLQLSDVDDGYIKIRRSINANNEITDCKNRNAKRTIKIHSVARKIIDDQIARVAILGVQWLFPARTGDHAHQHTVYMSWKHYAASRGLVCTPYELRHTFVSLMQKSMPEDLLKRVVGHSASMDTLGTYGHETDGQADAEIISASQYIEEKLTTIADNKQSDYTDANKIVSIHKGRKQGVSSR